MIGSKWKHQKDGVLITICAFQEHGDSWRIVSEFGDGGLITYPSAYFIYDWERVLPTLPR